MRGRSLPAVALSTRRGGPAPWLALLALLVVALQVPVQPTCLRLVWRFTAVELEAVDADAEPRDLESAPHPEALAPPPADVALAPTLSRPGPLDGPSIPRTPAREATSSRAPPRV